MAQKFVLSAALNIQSPSMNKVVRSINQQLQGVNVNLNVPNAAKTNKTIQNVNKNLKTTAKSADKATSSMQKLGASVGSTIGQFIKYDIARAAINLFSRAITDGLSDAIKFEREMVKIAQVTGATSSELKSLEREISRVSTSLGVASMSLLQASRVLAQTGMEAGKVKIALEALAKTTLAPTFDSIADTTETAVAVMAQFKVEAKDLEGVLGSINAVAGKFAVEAGDIGVAIRRAGGAFKSAGGQVNELIALFTSVRSTTRETAETIATGFRTIFTRMQRPGTIKFLEQFGVKLQDLNGKFVGPLEAVRKLHLVLKNLDPRDVRYSQIIEQLGGFRQVSKVIPLIQEFKITQEALNVAIAGTGSLSVDAGKAQDTFAVKITKLKEEVKELFRVISESTAFRVMLDGAIAMAKALTNITTTLGPLIPMLTAVFAIRGIGMLGGALGGIKKGISTQGGTGFARGGMVPGTGSGDTVPASLTPGEFVIRKSAVQAYGASNLANINKYAAGGPVLASDIQAGGHSTVQRRVIINPNVKKLRKKAEDPITNAHYYNPKDKFSIPNYQNRQISYSPIMGGKTGRKLAGYTVQSSPMKGEEGGAGTSRTYDMTKDPTEFAAIRAKAKSPSSGTAWENMLRTLGFMKDGANFGGNKPFDGQMPGGWVVEARSRQRSTNITAIMDKSIRHAELVNSAIGTRLTAGTENVQFPFNVRKYEDIGKIAGAKKKRQKRAAGGAITSQGTDSIPALLTPGEFVINKKSAQSFGYNKLSGINKYAKGGVVGGSRLKLSAGGGPMDMMGMMMMMGGGMGGGGGGGGDGASDSLKDLSNSADEASKGLKASLGGVTSGLGKVASSSLMAYSKIQFMGGIIDSIVSGMGIQNDTIHKVIGGLTNFTSWVYTAGTALSVLSKSELLSNMSGVFNSLKGNALVQMVAAPIRSLFGTMAQMAGGTAIGAGIATTAKSGYDKGKKKLKSAKGAFGQIKSDFAEHGSKTLRQRTAFEGAKASGKGGWAIIQNEKLMAKELTTAQGKLKTFHQNVAKHTANIQSSSKELKLLKGVHDNARISQGIATANVGKYSDLISRSKPMLIKMKFAQNALVNEHALALKFNKSYRNETKGLTEAVRETRSLQADINKSQNGKIKGLRAEIEAYKASAKGGVARNIRNVSQADAVTQTGPKGLKKGAFGGKAAGVDQIGAVNKEIAEAERVMKKHSKRVIASENALGANTRTIAASDEALNVLATNADDGAAALLRTEGAVNKLPASLKSAQTQQNLATANMGTVRGTAVELQEGMRGSRSALAGAQKLDMGETLASNVDRASGRVKDAKDAAAGLREVQGASNGFVKTLKEAAGVRAKLNVLGRSSGRLTLGLIKGMMTFQGVLAMGSIAAEHFLGKWSDSLGVSIKQQTEAGASWAEIESDVNTRAAVATGQSASMAAGTVAGGRFAGRLAGKGVEKLGQKVNSEVLKEAGEKLAKGIGKPIARAVAKSIGAGLVRSGIRAASTTASTGGTAALVEIPLLIGELVYALGNGADMLNNAVADYDSATFAKSQQELAVAFGAFKDGTLDAAAMSNKLADTHKLNAGREEQLARDRDSGNIGFSGISAASSFTMDNAAEGNILNAIGGGLSTILQVAFLPVTAMLEPFGVKGWWGRDNAAIEADSESSGRAKVEQRAMAPEIMAGAMEEAFAAMRSGDGSANTGATAFEAALGGAKNLEVIADLLGMEADVLRAKFKEQAKELVSIIKAQREFEAAMLGMARSTRAAMDIMLGIMSMAPQIASLETQIANTMAGFSGGISAANIVNKAPQFSDEALSSISSSTQWDNLEANVTSVAGYLGNAGSLIQEEFLGGAKVMSFLPDALETLKSDITNLTGDTSDAGQRVLDEIKNRISEEDWSKIPETIQNRIRTKINSLDINAENFDENMTAILQDAGAAFTPYQQALQEAATLVHKFNKMYGQALAQRNQMEMSFIQGQMKTLQLQQAGADMIRQAMGGELTAADSSASFQANQQVLLGGGSGLSGGGVQGPLGGDASGLGVGELGDLYVQQKRKMAELNEAISTATSSKDNEAEEVNALQEKFALLQKQTVQTKQALEAYTDVQKRAAGIQAELSKEQSARKTKRGALSDFAFSDNAGRASQVQGMQSAFTAIQAGDLGAVSEDQRGAVGAFLDKFENVTLAAFGGKTGGDIKKELEIKELEKVMGRSLSNDEKKGIMDSTSKEDKLINDLRVLNEEAVIAQEHLNEGIQVSINEMNTNMVKMNKTFLEDLKQIFVDRQKSRLEGEKSKDATGIKDVNADLKNATAALEMAGLGGVKEGADKDSALKTLTANKGLISQAQKAQTDLRSMKEGSQRMQRFGGDNIGKMEDKIQIRMGARDEGQNWSTGRVGDAVKAQTLMMAKMLAQGSGRQAGISASAELKSVFDRLQGGQTLSEATEGNEMARKSFEAAGYDEDYNTKKIKDMDANHAAAIVDSYMQQTMNAGANQAENIISTLKTALGSNPLFTPDVIDKILGSSEGLTEKLKSLLPDATFTGLNERLGTLNEHLAGVNLQIKELAKPNSEYNKDELQTLRPQNRAGGGPIYASTGMFIPKGTDTVPAMLTPGEFVIRRNAVQAVGMPLLQRINNMGKGGRQQGGDGYYHKGGNVDGGLSVDFSGLDRSINQFSQQITRLGDALSGGFNINVGGEINVNVRLNGAEMLEGAKDALGQVAADKVEKGITRMLKRHFPKLNNKSGLHRIKE